MGAEILIVAEVKNSSGSWDRVEDKIFGFGDHKTSSPFADRDYTVFGFLADVRNIDNVPCITGEAKYEVPSDFVVPDDWDWECHSQSWLLLRDLIEWDYEKVIDGFTGEGRVIAIEKPYYKTHSFKDVLGKFFFIDLEVLKSLGDPDDVRIVFCFEG